MKNKTQAFEHAISKAKDIHKLTDILKTLDNSSLSFSNYFKELFYSKNYSIKDFLSLSNISKASFYEFLNGSTIPNRDTIFKLAFALSLTRDETDRFLKLCNKGALYPMNPRDSIIIFCLNNNYTLIDTDIILYDNDLLPLTTTK
ncbi:helix-turn-helix transcriptional regulator [uncultured Clostridium sp.]|uniref:helix-turn-helix domain-containing protein n=1 Tax=uncultured Clostridium sp. TaxID=59620 RepID=UPI00261F1CB4|nr:helix-turn-helix transcriptional regulator [uncultured Clostridium sp.]